MHRLTGVLLGSLLTSGVAYGYPLPAPSPGTPQIVTRPEIRREVEFGGPVLGVQATDLTPELQEFFGTDGLGVLISRVFDDTAAADAGVQVGDVLVAVDGEPVSSIEDLRAAVDRAAGDDVIVEVVRDGDLVELDASLADMADPPDFVQVPMVPMEPHDIDRYVREWTDDEDVYRRIEDPDDRSRYERLDKQIEELQERMASQLSAIKDRLDALEEHGLGTGQVK